MKKKIICLDLDGVIYQNLVWMGSHTLKGNPVPGAKETIDKLKEDYKIIINSARFEDSTTIPKVKEWLDLHDIHYDEIAEKKPHADMYIDDKGIGFNGDWNKTLKDIHEFKQWQEKDKIIAKRLKNLHKKIGIISI